MFALSDATLGIASRSANSRAMSASCASRYSRAADRTAAPDAALRADGVCPTAASATTRADDPDGEQHCTTGWDAKRLHSCLHRRDDRARFGPFTECDLAKNRRVRLRKDLALRDRLPLSAPELHSRSGGMRANGSGSMTLAADRYAGPLCRVHRRARLVALGACLLVATPAAAQRVITEGALDLLLPTGARAVALGQATTALDGTTEAVWGNPSALARMQGTTPRFITRRASPAPPTPSPSSRIHDSSAPLACRRACATSARRRTRTRAAPRAVRCYRAA